MKPLLVVTTSDSYSHIVPIWIHLYKKYWNDPNQRVEIVGYKKPDFEMPDNFSFYSMGEQAGDARNFGTDLRKYFERLDSLVIWNMEDSFIKGIVDPLGIKHAVSVMKEDHLIGRLALGGNNLNQYSEYYDKEKHGDEIVQTPQLSEYRLSTQIAIWNKDFLLRYLKPNMSPWEFECQDKVADEFKNLSFSYPIVAHNEGCRKNDLYKYNFEGVNEEVIQEMKTKGIV